MMDSFRDVIEKPIFPIWDTLAYRAIPVIPFPSSYREEHAQAILEPCSERISPVYAPAEV